MLNGQQKLYCLCCLKWYINSQARLDIAYKMALWSGEGAICGGVD